MRHLLNLFCAATCLAILAACTTVSPQTTVVTQSATGGGGAAATAAPARPAAVPTGELVALENWSVTLVTAKSVPRPGEVHEIGDVFTFEGRVFAHAAFSSRPGVHGGQPNVEVRWSNADKLVSVQKVSPVVTKSPYYLVSSTSGTALGVGICSVEFVINGKPVASKSFFVTEK